MRPGIASRWLCAPVLITAVSAGCMTRPPQRTDRLCMELARFANTVNASTHATVALTTRWRPFEKGCTHGGDAAGMRLCRWLLSNASTERPEANVQRVLSCLDNAAAYAGQPELRADYLAGRLLAQDAPGVREAVSIAVEYEIGNAGKPSLLKLKIAERALE